MPTKKRRKPLDAKALSKRHMEKLGYDVGNVERSVNVRFKTNLGERMMFKKFDLFGVFDLLAFDEERTIGIQVTTSDHNAAHRATMEASEPCIRWTRALRRFSELHIWKRADGVKRLKHSLRRWRMTSRGTWVEIIPDKKEEL